MGNERVARERLSGRLPVQSVDETVAATRRLVASHLEWAQRTIRELHAELEGVRQRYQDVVRERNSLLSRIAGAGTDAEDRRAADGDWRRLQAERDELRDERDRLQRENGALSRKLGSLAQDHAAERQRRMAAEEELDYLVEQAAQLRSLTRTLEGK